MPLLIAAILVVVAWKLFGAPGGGTGGISNGGNSAATDSQLGAPQAEQGAPDAIQRMAQAIFHMEGGKPGDPNVRNMNPGNLRTAPNQVGTSGGFAVEPDWVSGWDDLYGLITKRAKAHPDWDFYDFFNYYLRGSTTAPSVDAQGNSDVYAEYVAGQLGAQPTMPVASVLGVNS